ncbi:hypothetical protein [Escherichia coli]|uniref:hypothetical protein n=1 Tax=Escherichia coli TaxID=562 RepID=UPI00201B3035|nr:hypothetical protein [Escherichia coli]MDC9145519.1 hypothetical protein [Escherichia coli]
MEALVVERSEDGYWTHPEYANLFGDREVISADEFRLSASSMALNHQLLKWKTTTIKR